MSIPSALNSLLSRRSVPSRLLTDPGPDDAQLSSMLAAAVRVPDHGNLAPWRFLVIRGSARQRLGEVLAVRQRERDVHAPDTLVEKDRQRFNHAPMIVAVVASVTPGHKVPEQEQLLSAGCVCLVLLQAAQALGFGAQWLTGWAAYDDVVSARLGLTLHERVVGFVHVGTARDTGPERVRPDPAQRVTEWIG